MAGVGKSGSPAPRSVTPSPAAFRGFASCEMAIVAEVSRCCRLGDKPLGGLMGERIALPAKGTQPRCGCLPGPQDVPSPAIRPLTIEDRVTAADAKAALERGRPVVLVRPPAVEQVGNLWELVGPATPGHGPGVSPHVLILCADPATAAEWAAAAPAEMRAHAVTGLARSAQILAQGLVHVLAGEVNDLAALVQRSALKLDQVSAVVIAWPETLIAGDRAATLDTMLAELRDARRIVLSWNPAALTDFLERHARRAELIGTPGADESGRPLPPVCRARFAVIPSFRRSVAVHDALDALGATKAFIWTGGPIAAPDQPPDAVVCSALPTRDE